MRKFTLVEKIFLLFMCIPIVCFAADRITLQSGNGNELGTTGNPLIATITAGNITGNLTVSGTVTSDNFVGTGTGDTTFNSNVGIGITVPTEALHVVDSVANGSYVATIDNETNGGEYLQCVNGSDNAVIQLKSGTSGDGFLDITAANGSAAIRFFGASGAKSFIDSGANVGIGIQDPNYLLEVDGTFQADDYYSGDGTLGVTVTTCTSFKDGLCVAGT